MTKAATNGIIYCITSLFNHIVYKSRVPNDWHLPYIINLFKGKVDALYCGSYRDLKLQDHVMKVLERILTTIIREKVSTGNIQFDFIPGRGTTDVIFILVLLQEKYLNRKKNNYFAFVNLERALDRVPHTVLWWAVRKLGIDEWIIQTVKYMYYNVHSKVRITSCYSKSTNVSVCVHQGSVLSSLLFINVMEALSHEFSIECPYELL